MQVMGSLKTAHRNLQGAIGKSHPLRAVPLLCRAAQPGLHLTTNRRH